MSPPVVSVVCAGDRDWTDRRSIEYALHVWLPERYDVDPLEAPTAFRIAHGGQGGWRDAPGGKRVLVGADAIVDDVCQEAGVPVRSYPVDWKEARRVHGPSYRKEGPIRNRRMLDAEEPGLVLAFHDDLARSRGTRDLVEEAQRRGIVVVQFRHMLVPSDVAVPTVPGLPTGRGTK